MPRARIRRKKPIPAIAQEWLKLPPDNPLRKGAENHIASRCPICGVAAPKSQGRYYCRPCGLEFRIFVPGLHLAEVVHAADCRRPQGGPCSCRPSEVKVRPWREPEASP